MTRAAIISIRRLISATLFLIAGLFIAINIGVFDSATLSTTDTILALIWASCWCLAATHNLYYRAIVAHRAINSEAPIFPLDDHIAGLRRSTHSQIKAALTTTTAASALAMDLYRIKNPAPTNIARVLGSINWLNLGFFEFWLARRHERKQEDNPDHPIQPLGVRPSVYHATHACIYLATGIAYATGVWLNNNRSPLHTQPEAAWLIPMPNLCWLLAGVNEVTRTLQIAIEERGTDLKEEADHSITMEEVKEENNVTAQPTTMEKA